MKIVECLWKSLSKNHSVEFQKSNLVFVWFLIFLYFDKSSLIGLIKCILIKNSVFVSLWVLSPITMFCNQKGLNLHESAKENRGSLAMVQWPIIWGMWGKGKSNLTKHKFSNTKKHEVAWKYNRVYVNTKGVLYVFIFAPLVHVATGNFFCDIRFLACCKP